MPSIMKRRCFGLIKLPRPDLRTGLKVSWINGQHFFAGHFFLYLGNMVAELLSIAISCLIVLVKLSEEVGTKQLILDIHIEKINDWN